MPRAKEYVPRVAPARSQHRRFGVNRAAIARAATPRRFLRALSPILGKSPNALHAIVSCPSGGGSGAIGAIRGTSMAPRITFSAPSPVVAISPGGFRQRMFCHQCDINHDLMVEHNGPMYRSRNGQTSFFVDFTIDFTHHDWMRFGRRMWRHVRHHCANTTTANRWMRRFGRALDIVRDDFARER